MAPMRNWVMTSSHSGLSISLLRGQGAALETIRDRVRAGLQSYRQGQAVVLPTRAWLLGAEAE